MTARALRGFMLLLMVTSGVQGQSIVLRNGELHTMSTAGVIHGGSLLILDGCIVDVGVAIHIPANAHVIDANGQIVTPGFMDAASDLGLVEVYEEDRSNDASSKDLRVGASFEVAYAINTNSAAIPVHRLAGVTLAVVMPGAGKSIFSGISALLRLGDAPDVLIRRRAGLNIDLGESGAQAAGGSRAAAWAQLRQTFDIAQFSRDLPRPRRERTCGSAEGRLCDAWEIRAAISERIPLIVRVDRESEIRDVVRFATTRKLHVVIDGGSEAWRVADLLATARIPVIVHVASVPPARFESMGASLHNAERLNRAGVLIAFSGASPDEHAPRLTQFAGIAVAHGLPWSAALMALTVNPARIWGIEGHYGSLARGMAADVVIWDGDPLEVTSAPVSVLVAGRTYELRSRQTELRDRYLKKSAWPPAYR